MAPRLLAREYLYVYVTLDTLFLCVNTRHRYSVEQSIESTDFVDKDQLSCRLLSIDQ